MSDRNDKKDMTNHPEHYGGEGNPYEAINIIEAMGWGEGFCMGSAIKYLLRSGHKSGEPAERDLGKSKWFIDRRIYEIENGIDGRMDVEEARKMALSILGLEQVDLSESNTEISIGGILGTMFSRGKAEANNEPSEKITPIRSISDIGPIYDVLADDGKKVVVMVDIPMSFGNVLDAMKADSSKKFARKGWNGKGIYIQLQTPDEGSMNTLPYIFIVTNDLDSDNPDAPRGRVPWLASQTDMLAEDWVEIEIVETGCHCHT